MQMLRSSFIFSLFLSPILILSQNIIRGPYLQTPSDTYITIKWRTDAPTDSKVWFGNDSVALTFTLEDTVLETDHELKLTNLNPYTTYYYGIGSSSGMIGSGANYRFKTSPVIGTIQPVRTWVIGDFGKGNQSQIDVMNSYISQFGDHTDVWLWMGDNAYDDGEDNEYQTKVFEQYDSIFPFIPFYPTPGNHDYNSMGGYSILTPTAHTNHNGAYYDIVTLPKNGEIGGYPSGTEAFYSFDYGNVHYISLNSEIQNTNSRNTAMENWLQQDLSPNTKDWTIVYWHQPPYSKGSHDSDDIWEIFMRGMRKNILPILDAGGVDLVLCGHSHNYERSYLMKGHYGYSYEMQPSMILNPSSGNPDIGESYVKYHGSNCSEEGIVYAVVGNSGSKTAPGDDEGLNHPAMYISDGEDAVGSLILEIHGDTLVGNYMRSSGLVVDKFQILRVNCDTVSTSTIDENENQVVVKVYSDYKTGEFRIRFDLSSESPVTLFMHDLNGKEVYRHDFGNLSQGDHYHRIYSNDFNLAPGMYHFSIVSKSGVVSKKVFKLKP